jgi:uncharacterized protein (DUF4213/DUF364 family)
MSNPWQLYDDLIDALPAGVTVDDCVISRFALVSTSAGGHGLALADRAGRRVPRDPESVVGRDLRSVASLAKSWDFELAALGVAAMNSWFNTEQRVVDAGATLIGADGDSFVVHAQRVAGRRVGVVGHFAGLRHLTAADELIVLERDAHGDDYPDPACEYLLAGCDEVFITGTAVTNKTLPRLLELAADARTVLVGPSTPFAPEVYGSRVDEIGGAWVADANLAGRLARMGASMRSMKQVFTRFNASFDHGANR